MARVLKLYTIERRHGIVSRPLIEALGLPAHIQQVTIYLVASTKKAAQAMAAQTPGIPTPNMSSDSFKVATGYNVNALIAAGFPAEPAVYIYIGPGYGAPDRRVLRVASDGSTTLAGHLDGYGIATTFVATQASEE